MYIQLTERCNMNCEHCCMDAKRNGKDMDWYTFIKAMTSNYADYITLGGGEPTLWKQFSDGIEWIEDMILSSSGCAYTNTGSSWLSGVLIITNGTRLRNTMKAIKLMEYCEDMGEADKFRVVLSANDGYHDITKQHQKLIDYFTRRQQTSKRLGRWTEFIRSVNRVLPVGRAITSGVATEESGCACEDLFVQTDGKVRLCGCPDAPIVGSVFDDTLDLDDWTYECYKNQKDTEEEVEAFEKETEECLC